MTAPLQAQPVIASRYNGPPHSGNGGYSCGVLAVHVGDTARIRLHVPPPLDTPFRVERRVSEEGTETFEMYDCDTLVGTGAPATWTHDIPAAPPLDKARAAMEHYVGHRDHTFPTCFVCGPQRPHSDGLSIFPGSIEDDESLLACVWEPGADMLDETGAVLPEIVWAALDCPGYFAAMEGELRPALLGELLGDLRQPVPGNLPLIVYCWPMGKDGRKHYGGTAIADGSGAVLACSYSTWIELRS